MNTRRLEYVTMRVDREVWSAIRDKAELLNLSSATSNVVLRALLSLPCLHPRKVTTRKNAREAL